MNQEYDAVLIGGMALDFHGRPLGPFRLRTAAAMAGYSVKVIDFASVLTEHQLLEVLQSVVSSKTKAIGISTSWTDFLLGDGYVNYNSWLHPDFVHLLKTFFPGTEIIGGGTKVDVHHELVAAMDWFMLGFSDVAFVKFLDHVCNGAPRPRYTRHEKFAKTKVVDSNAHYQIIDHDQIETVMVAEDDFKSFQPIPLEVSRGCIFKCSFCTHPFLGKKSYDYIRSAESIARELKRNYELFGTYRYSITDDTFNDSIEKLDRVRRAIDIAKIPKFEFVAYVRPEILVTKPEMIPILGDLSLQGALFGIESFNNQARKFVGKGMDVQRVLDTARKLAEQGTKLHATLILGLPGDNVEDWYQWHDYLKSNNETLFRSWSWHALNIRNRNVEFDDVDEGYSVFEKDPEAYGYRDASGSIQRGERFLDWVNHQGVTRNEAMKHQDILHTSALQDSRFGGWAVATAWYQGISQQQIETSHLLSVRLRDVAKQNISVRAQNQYHKITGKDLDFSVNTLNKNTP